jgi:FkbM family methyltransferase
MRGDTISASLFSQAVRELFFRFDAWPPSFFEDRLAEVYAAVLGPGGVALDIGAHSGVHSQRFADIIGPEGTLIAVEPLPEVFTLLEESLGGTKCKKILFQGVVGPLVGKTEFLKAHGNLGESGLHARLRYDGTVRLESIEVESVTLEEICRRLDRLDFIKIDTEGAELSILESGRSALNKFRPFVSVEWGVDTYGAYGHVSSDLWGFARENFYSISDLFLNIVKSKSEWLEVSDRAGWDFILVPDEKLAEFLYSATDRLA